MNTTHSTQQQKRKRCEYQDPDYQQLDNNLTLNCNYEIQSSKINILSRNCAGDLNAGAQIYDTRLRQIEAIIDGVYNNEIAVRENQLSLIENNLMNSRKLLEKLRFNIVTQYYGEQQLNLTLQNDNLIYNSNLKFGSENKKTQTAMHPAVQKLISKRPREIYRLCPERVAAQNAKTTIRQKIKRPIYNDQYKQQFKHIQEGIVEHMGSNQNKNIKRFKTNAYHNIISTATPNEVGSKMISSTTTGVNIHHKAVTANRLNNKIKYLITIGNTSKYIGNEMKRDFNRQGSHIFTHKWLVYVTTKEPKTPLEYYVKRVRFHLHDSYRPNNVVDVVSPPFQLSRFGWGEFPIRIQLYFHSYFHEKPIQFVHYIILDKSHTGIDTIGAETIVQIWLRNISQKEHQIQIKKSIIPECSNNGRNSMVATDVSTEVLEDALMDNLVEFASEENCSDTQFTQTSQTNSTTCSKQVQSYTLSQQEQHKQPDDNQCETLQNKTDFVNSTDCLQEHIRTNESITKTSCKTNDNNKSATSAIRTVMLAKCNPYVNHFVGNDTIQMKNVTAHNISLQNSVKKVEYEVVGNACKGSTLFVNTYTATVCQNNAKLHTLTTQMMTAAITTTVATTKIVSSTRESDYNNSCDFRNNCNCISTHKQDEVISCNNANNRYILSSTTAPTISNALHLSAQHSPKIVCLKPCMGVTSAALIQLDNFISKIPKTKQAMPYTSTSSDVNNDRQNEINLNTTFSTVPGKFVLLANEATAGLKYSNCQMTVNPIPMISIKPIVSSINGVNAFVPNTIATNSNEMTLQQQQPKQTLNFFEKNMVQCTNTFGNVKFVPMLAVTTSNVNEKFNNQQYQQFIIRKQRNFNEACKAQINPISTESSTLKMEEQGRTGDILISKSNPIMVTVKLPNTLSNRHSNNNVKTTISIPAGETARSTGLTATTSGKHAINSRHESIKPDVLMNDSTDNFLVMQPNLLTSKINVSRITSMKNVIIQKEGKLCIIDPMQTKLKQRLQGKQVSLLKPCISLLNYQLNQQSKQHSTNQVMATNSRRLDQIFLNQHFSTMNSAIDFLLKSIKLIGKSKLANNMFPFVTQSSSEFQSLNALKQRSREWLRAKTISRLLHKHLGLQRLQRSGKFDFWSIKEIAIYARNYAFTPNIKPLNPPKEADLLIDAYKTKHNHYKNSKFAVLVKNELQLSKKGTPIDTTTDKVSIMKWLANAWHKLLIYEQQLEEEAHIDIEIDNTTNSDPYKNNKISFSKYSYTKFNPLCTGPLRREHTLRCNNNALLQIPFELHYEYALCSNFLRNLNIQLHPEELCAHVWHSTAHVLLAHCLQSFIDKLLRQSFALKIQELQRQHQHKEGKYKYINTINLNEYINVGEYTLEVQDIVRVLKKNHAEFDFLTNRNFGCEPIHFTYSQIKQET